MITKNILRSLLISIILVHNSWAKPSSEHPLEKRERLKSKDLCLLKTNHDMEPSEKDLLLSPSNQLLIFTLRAFQELSLQYVINAKNISEHLLKNNELLSSHSTKILEFKQNLTQFEEKYNLCNGLEELFELVELYSNRTSYYFELNDTSLDTDDKLILRLLRKYGSEDLDEEAMIMLNGFVDSFDKKFEDLKEALSKEEGKRGKNLLKWFDHFKTLKNFDDKIVAFEQFFILYEDPESVPLLAI